MSVQLQTITDYNLVNMGISIVSCMVSILALCMLCAGFRMDPKGSRHLIHATVFDFLYAIACFFEEYSVGMNMAHERLFLHVSIIGQYICNYLMLFYLLSYLIVMIEEKGSKIKWKMAIHILMGIKIGELIINYYHPFLYYIDSANVLHRMWMFNVQKLGETIFILLWLYVLYFYREELYREITVSYIVFVSFYAFARILGLISRQIDYVGLASTIAIFIMALYIEAGKVTRAIHREEEITRMKNQLLVSLLRPHFLYNALSSISQLAKKDPERASVMTQSFSQYIRKNVRDIDRSEPIPFAQELEYIKNYISIEEMRFGDDLKVSYAIESTDFFVPPLVLQPLVENSIKHGIGKKEDGGRIFIAARAFKENHIITIRDDGVGYETDQLPMNDDERVHVGMKSVIRRINSIPGARFIVKSNIGEGTINMLIIPNSYTNNL